MNLKYGTQLELLDISGQIFDLFLFANNIEKRKLTAYNAIRRNNKILRTIALNYNDSFEPELESSTIENYTVINIDDIRCIFKTLLDENTKDTLNIYIDYSCMTKPWYYAILNYLAEKKINRTTVNCFFSYTPSTFSTPLPPKQNTKIEPVEGSYKIPNNKPKALIVCLGYEQNKAQGIIDQLDPKLTYLCYTDPSLDPRFVHAIKKNNTEILKDIKDEYIFTYPFDDIKYLEKQLTSLYYTLRDEYNIIFAPLGPKPFTFVSMVLSIIFPEIEVWRVDSGLDLNRYERSPISASQLIISKIIFEHDKQRSLF